MHVHTSQTDPLRIAKLPAGRGAIGLTLCPGKHQDHAAHGCWRRDLATDIGAIAQWGARDVVTLMEDHELDLMQVSDLGPAVEHAGMRWHHLPIRDASAPGVDFERAWSAERTALLATLAAGGRVLVHCRGGLGRTGTIAAALLLAIDRALPADAAIERVRAVRPGAIETAEQERWLRSQSSNLAGRSDQVGR